MCGVVFCPFAPPAVQEQQQRPAAPQAPPPVMVWLMLTELVLVLALLASVALLLPPHWARHMQDRIMRRRALREAVGRAQRGKGLRRARRRRYTAQVPQSASEA